MTFADGLNQLILDLWYRREFGLDTKRPRMPRVYSALQEGGLLTVGLNPSFNIKAFKKFAPNIVPEELFGWRDDVGTFNLKLACEIDTAALTSYDEYYGPHLGPSPLNWPISPAHR